MHVSTKTEDVVKYSVQYGEDLLKHHKYKPFKKVYFSSESGNIHYVEMKWKWNPRSIYENEKFKKLWDYETASMRSLSTTICDCGWYTLACFVILEKKLQKKCNTDWLTD